MRPTPLRPRTDIGGGRRVPQLRSCRNVPKTAILARGPRAPVQRTPLFPPHCTARSASRWRGSSTAPDLVGGERPLPRTFRRSRWGQNSKLRWHRAAPVHHCSRWLSKAKKGLGGGSSGGWRPEHQLQPPHHITQMCLCHRSTKNFCQAAHISPPLLRTDYCACCRF